MADKETGLNIPVSAVADKNSAKEAVNELTKDVLSSLKDGYIEIPAELKVPIKGASKDLEKAQKDVINQWEKTFKEGFSSSAKDLDALTEAYQRFKKLAGQQHKTGTKQSKGISAIMGDQIQAYTMSKKDVQARRAEFKKQIEKAQKRNTKQGMTSDEKKLLKEEIDHAIAQEYKRKGYGKLSKDLGRGASRAKAVTPGAPINLGLRSPAMGGPYVSEHTLRMSEISPYRNMDEVRKARELAEIRKAERASLTSRRATTEEVEGSKQRVKQREAAGRSQSGTEYELIKKALLTELAKIQGGLIKGRPDATSQKLIDQVFANLAYDEEQGIDPLKSITGIHNMLQKRYDTKGKIGITDGSVKGEGKNQEEANETLKQIYKILGQFIDARQSVAENVRNIRDTLSTDRASGRSSLYSQELNRITNSDQMQAMKEALRPLESGMTGINRSVKIGNTKEAVEFDQSEKINKENKDINRDTARTVKKDAATGFNTDSKADTLIQLVSSILQHIQKGIPITEDNKKVLGKQAEQETTDSDTSSLSQQKTKSYSMEMAKVYDEIEKVISPIENALVPLQNSARASTEIPKAISKSEFDKIVPELTKEEYQNQVQKSTIYASPLRQGIRAKLESAFDDLIGTTKKYEKILKANADEQDTMAAERIRTYGLNNGRNPNDTGDIAGMRRILQLYRTNKASIEQNPELAQKIQLTPGRDIDTTEITKALNEALSGKNMRNAQMGGSIPRQILGGITAFIGMPSLEKSRAQADGLNQILGNINNALQSVLINIQTKETELAGMEASGQAKFTKEGYLTPDSTSAAFKTLADLEEEKLVFDSIKADLLANDEIIKRTGGRFSQLVKHLNFTSPVLKENNGILRNINSGLDKNGKALKFQTRMAEILNYTFQLMSRSIGQMIKNWLSMINPINVIKRLFNDFGSYNVKWQRTMNVIKNNFREIILPFMDKIAQTLVNIIGFLDIISMKIQEAFGFTPISLFDQKNANEFKKTYEEITSVTASFDELHDIGSNPENDADNLLGEIYKPELSQEWIDLANEIGDLFAGVIKGDLGFGEAMLEILKIAWEGIKTLWNEILWPFIRDTIWPAIKDNVLGILAWILGAFVAWKGLKLIGSLLWNAISGAFVKGSGTSLLKRLFTDANGIVGIGRNVGTLISGAILAVISTMAIADAINSAWNQGASDAITDKDLNLTDSQTGMDALQSALGGAGLVLGGGMVATALGASVALGPLVAVAAGVAALAAVVTVGAEAWSYYSKQNQIANNEMLTAEEYAEQAAATQEKLNEVMNMVNDGLEIKNSHQEKLNQLEEEYGISLDYVTKKVEVAGGSTSSLTEKEKALYEQGKLTQESIENYNRLLEIQIELQNQQLWQKEQEAIALDMEAGNYELATLRIEQAELKGVITTEEATAKRIQLYKQCGEEERANLLQNLTPEQRALMMQYTDATNEELGELARIWRESSDTVREALLDGVGPDTIAAFESRMSHIDRVIKEHTGAWQAVGDTLKEVFTLGFADTWTYNGEEKYYKEGYADTWTYDGEEKYYKEGYAEAWANSEIESIQNDNTLSEEEKRRRIQNIRNMAMYAVGTNYVPNDGLAYLHQGEAVIPKKYNQPYQPPNTMSQAYMDQMLTTMRSLDNTIQQGIDVRGEFRQRGTDLVATVKKVENRSGNQPLNNAIFAR